MQYMANIRLFNLKHQISDELILIIIINLNTIKTEQNICIQKIFL